MEIRDVKIFADNRWQEYKASITDISKSGNCNGSLVQSTEVIYSFDQICQFLFSNDRCPSSADGLAFTKKALLLIEFKSGFKQNITKDNYDPDKAKCEYSGEPCPYYYQLFRENRKLKREELIHSIRLKAIESVVTLEKHVFPCCCKDFREKRIPINFIVVIDGYFTEGIEDILATLAKSPCPGENVYNSIKQALSRLMGNQDYNRNIYYYDKIEVMSCAEFYNFLDSHQIV